MDNLFTEEETSRPVTYGELAVILEKVVQTWINSDNETYEESLKLIGATTDALIDAIKDFNYKRMRDVRFFFCLLSDLGYGTLEHLYNYYSKWCEDYDKLNQSQQEE